MGFRWYKEEKTANVHKLIDEKKRLHDSRYVLPDLSQEIRSNPALISRTLAVILTAAYNNEGYRRMPHGVVKV